jgi:hypothetical protein
MRMVILAVLAVTVLGGCGQAPKSAVVEHLAFTPNLSIYCGQAVIQTETPAIAIIVTQQGDQSVLENGVHTYGECSFEVRAGRAYDMN